jgi:hypothetical protein
MAKRGKAEASTRAAKLGAGTAKHYANPAEVLKFDGASLPVSDVTTKLQRVGTLRTNTVSAQAVVSAAVAVEDSELPALLAFMSSYTAFVRATFGNSPTSASRRGRHPRRPPWRRRWRPSRSGRRPGAARGTTGPKKKLSVKGNVTGVEITPVTTPGAGASASSSPSSSVPRGPRA